MYADTLKGKSIRAAIMGASSTLFLTILKLAEGAIL